MTLHSLGRSKLQVPRTVLRLAWPHDGFAEAERLVESALRAGCVMDVTDGTLLWGPLLRDQNCVTLYRGGLGVQNAASAEHAATLVAADLLQAASALGRPLIDVFVLRSLRALETYQLDGAIEAIDGARADGLVRFGGLSIEGPEQAGLMNWQFRDAFDIVMAPSNFLAARALASERRVGFISDFLSEGQTADTTGFCVRTVRSAREVDDLCAASTS